MEILDHLRLGFDVAFTPINFFYCLVGALLGTLVGVLPGIGPVTTIAMLLPLTFKMPAVASLIMLAGIYYGAHHAGSTTAIMLNMPGEPSSIVICLDGHPMAKQGRAGVALFISRHRIVLCRLRRRRHHRHAGAVPGREFAADRAARIYLHDHHGAGQFGRRGFEFAADDDRDVGARHCCIGTVGTDVSTGSWRFTFGSHLLTDGVSFVAVATGLFAFAEVIAPYRQAGGAHRSDRQDQFA